MKKQLDWNAVALKAQEMSIAQLHYAIKDCIAAGDAAWEMEKAGCAVSKDQGYYYDEAWTYRSEISKRDQA